MCLLVKLKEEHTRNGSIAEQIWQDYVTVAEKDIEVYKVLTRHEDGDLISQYHKYIYKVGETYKEDFTYADHITSHIGYNRVYDHLALHRGLHSYRSIEAALLDVTFEHNEVVCRFTIPKGAFVFVSGEELCSNELKFEEVLAYAGEHISG